MSSNQWVNQAIAVVAGVVAGVFTAGTAAYATYAAVAGLATYAVVGTVANYVGGVNRPKNMNIGGGRLPMGMGNRGNSSGTVRDAASQSLNINSASEAVLCPVVFGRCLVSGNNTRYDVALFRNVPIIERIERDPNLVAYALAQEAYKRDPEKVDHEINQASQKQNQNNNPSGGGGKGGSDSGGSPPAPNYSSAEKVQAYQQILLSKDSAGSRRLPKEYDEYIAGYRYFLTWELGICMGPITALHHVRVYPGEFSAFSAPFPTVLGDELNFNGSGGEQGGRIRMYRGSHTQVRNVADPYNTPMTNYRGVCFAVFEDYYIGTSPAPSSYAFDIERQPICLRKDGTPVPGLKLTASANPASAAAQDANPAAILWEVFTNQIWGKGMDPDLLDEESFVQTSQYFEAEEIGMSFTLESQTIITEAVEQIRSHVQTVVIWSNGKLYCRCLMDRSRAYSPMITLTADSVSDPQLARPTWPSCPNELRANFCNRYNNFQSEIVIAQDMAGIATQGRINSTTIDYPAFSNRATCDKAVRRNLAEISYPQATLSLKLNRFHSHLMPSDFVRFIWNEWSGGSMTCYYRITEISDKDQDSGGIQLRLLEDLYATPHEGESVAFVPPVPAYEGQTITDDTDVNLAEPVDLEYVGGISNLQIVEMPISLTDGDRVFAIFCQRTDGLTQSIRLLWRPVSEPSGDWRSLGRIAPWAITGKLVTSIPDGPKMTRAATWEIELEEQNDRARFLEYCNTIPTASDPIDKVTGSETNFLRVGDEMMQVAQAEAGSASNRVRVTGVIRGQNGTDRTAHAADTPVAFCYQFIPYVYTFRYDLIPLGVAIDFRATPINRNGIEGDEITSVHTFTNLARKPLVIETWISSAVGLAWNVDFRPRFHNRGAEIYADWEASINALTQEIPEIYQFFVMPRNGGGVALLTAPALVAPTFVPDDGNTPAGGRASFAYAAPVGTATLDFYTAHDGVLSDPVNLLP